jgi:hypothetical protein
LPYSNPEELFKSLTRLKALEGTTVFYPVTITGERPPTRLRRNGKRILSCWPPASINLWKWCITNAMTARLKSDVLAFARSLGFERAAVTSADYLEKIKPR